jgi:hypothetical protein
MPRALSLEVIATKILFIRGQRVMLDRDLARLYGVSLKVLNQAVKRNIQRFPSDFMYRLTLQEVKDSRSQIVTLNSELSMVQEVGDLESGNITSKQGQNIKYLPYAFTEQGVAMLSSVLNSERAIRVNIMIMRAFVKLKELLLTHKDLAEKIAELEKKYDTHDDKIQLIFEAIRKLLEPQPEPKKPPIGFHRD